MCSCLLQVSISLKFYKDLQQYGADKVGCKEMCVHTCSYPYRHPMPTTVYLHIHFICMLVASNVRIYLSIPGTYMYVCIRTFVFVCTCIHAYVHKHRIIFACVDVLYLIL